MDRLQLLNQMMGWGFCSTSLFRIMYSLRMRMHADMTIKRNFTSAGLFTIQSKLIYQQLLIQEFPGPTNCAKTMIQSLIYKFNELQQEVAGIEQGSEDFHAIKELS